MKYLPLFDDKHENLRYSWFIKLEAIFQSMFNELRAQGFHPRDILIIGWDALHSVSKSQRDLARFDGPAKKKPK